jgi:hypothetical protein
MSEKRDIAGLWWLPTNPDERWVGTLTLECDKSPRLTVTVPKSAFQFLDQETLLPVIHGHDQHGKPITLLFPGCHRTHVGMALSQMEFTAGYAILGIQLSDHTTFQINSLSLRMQHLLEWGGITGFSQDRQVIQKAINIRYELPSDQSFTIDSDLTIKLQPTSSFNNGWNEKNIREDLCVTFLSKKGLGLSQCKELITGIRHLLHFAILKRVYPLQITARKDGYGLTHNEQFFPDDLEMWNSIIRQRVESEFFPDRWVFQLKDVQADFGKFITNWLEYVKKFEEALDCYSATIYHRLPDSIEHLCLTQAFDAYHGIKFASHKEQDFMEKLQELAEANKTHLHGLVDDVSEFAKTVIDNRNYYTHHNPKWKKDGRVLSGGKLLRLNEKLRLLFQVCVLTDIGIPADRFVRLRRQLATHIVDYI